MIPLKKTNPTLHMYDGDTIKWEDDGTRYCLHVQRDEFPESPREWDNLTVMACWHRRYSLGDDIGDKEPEDFWRRLVRENVSELEVFAAVKSGQLDGIRVAENEEDPGLVDVYETWYLRTAFGKSEPRESLEYEGVDKETAIYYIMDDLTVGQCQTLLEPYMEWMPLWLYDHSGISMSCGARTYPYNDRWDSGQVGWIVALKKTIMAETSEYVLDDNGNKIRIEHKHPDGNVTYSFMTRPLTDDTWRARAIEIMEADVEVYDQYLTGDTFVLALYEADGEGDWNEVERIGGFFGTDILTNGIADEAPGLWAAIKEDRYETGTAEKHVSTYYTF